MSAVVSVPRGRPEPPPEPWRPAADPCTDLANAHRLHKRFSGRLMYARGLGWLRFEPSLAWRADEGAAILDAASIGRDVLSESGEHLQYAAKLPGGLRERAEKHALELLRHARSSESAKSIRASLGLAQGLLAVEPSALDAALDLLPLQGGVLDLINNTHRPHRPDDLQTRVAGCEFVPGATCPLWEAFVAEVIPDDGARTFVRKVMGYSLSARRGEHIVLMFLGAGCNGKSVLLSTWAALLGELAVAAPPDLLTSKQGGHPTELAMLRGARFVHLSEPQDGRLAVERLKALSGGDRISARHMNRDFFEFEPRCLLAVALNHRLRTNDAGEALWRRVREVEFTVTIPPERRDALLADRLRAELPGILLWALEGWKLYQAEGLQPPDAVRAATDAYREASDPLGEFLEECCTLHQHCSIASSELHTAFSKWAHGAGEMPLSRRLLCERLEARGLTRYRLARGVRAFRGVALKVGDA